MKVVVRVRPACDQEAGSSVALQVVDQIDVLVFDPKSSHIEAGKRGPHKPKGKCYLFDMCMTRHPLRKRCLKAPQKWAATCMHSLQCGLMCQLKVVCGNHHPEP